MAPPDCPRRQTHQDILDNDLSLELRRSKEGQLDLMGKRPPMEFASRNLVAEIEEAQLKLRMAEQSFAASTSDLQDCEHQLKLINAKRAEEVCKIGQRLKDVLQMNPKLTIGYQAHSDTMNKSGSIAKNRYVV